MNKLEEAKSCYLKSLSIKRNTDTAYNLSKINRILNKKNED
jgi:hypothetical protein